MWDLPGSEIESVSPTLAGGATRGAQKVTFLKSCKNNTSGLAPYLTPCAKVGPGGLPISNTSVASSHNRHMGTDSAQVRGQLMSDRRESLHSLRVRCSNEGHFRT